ncbi:GRB2-associated-binding protein 1 [Cylas formicarius]|uniref:GRB2-associated-binding protein 1 n=1 Tax=Cylas formicarius TaxID=197179 RepID=UPI0029583251|nr:GRB2-associated-binding protein 1 [Cylas formicarius]
MAKNSQEIIFEGWLTKSPPTKRIWRARWRRRWFLLTHTGELPGQYILTYYTDRNCRKLKGVINLDHCEQVDLGLKLDERNLKLDHVFDIKTPNRTYYLAADTEEEMKSWVTCICKVCGLKSTSEEDDVGVSMNIPSDIEVVEENIDEKFSNAQETPPISPVSTGPYIPISECFTGKSPVLDPKDFKTLFEYNRKNSLLRYQTQSQASEIYEFPHRTYINYVNEFQDPRFYDSPRQLIPANLTRSVNAIEKRDDNHSPLQSPTDSDSVFNDEDWIHTAYDSNSLTKARPSDSSADLEISATQKFTKVVDSKILPPPRPPKPPHITPPCYLNLTLTTKPSKEMEIEEKLQKEQKIITDDMYDFPRSHNIENESLKTRRHCYNNAAPVRCMDGTIFRYDVSPKPSTSTSVFRYDLEAMQAMEPSSPAHSHTSSNPAYSNLPSPSFIETPLMPPPAINRELKPRRKLSDSHSTGSNPEPPSPRNAPSVDRKLKPPTPLQEANMRKSFQKSDEEGTRKLRAAPSPVPPTFKTSVEDLYQNQTESYHYIAGKMQYLDLDLEGSSSVNSTKTLPRAQESDTVYKKVDFMKTQAFNITRNNLEKERQEPVTTFVKK